MMLTLSGLLLGLIGLWFGTDWTINNAIRIARRYRLSEMFVGVGILAIGTDLPELAVAVDAGIKQLDGINTSAMIVGSSIGSAFAQIGLVMGIVGVSGFLLIGREHLMRYGSVLIGSIVVLFVLGYDYRISRIDGLVLLLCFAFYLFMIAGREQHDVMAESAEMETPAVIWRNLIAGLIIVVAASEIVVYSVVNLAERLDISQTLIALFIVGPGTSLPELSISLTAINKHKAALSVGNILGSNIFDTLVPVGCAALIHPLSVSSRVVDFDLPALAALSLLVLLLFLHRKGLQRMEAIVVLACYLLYAVASFAIS